MQEILCALYIPVFKTKFSLFWTISFFKIKSGLLRTISLGRSAIEVPGDLSDVTTDLQVVNLELLHHWTMFACHGFGDKPGDRIPWQIEIPQIACKQPFLMRGILAISALHMSRVRPEQKQKYLMLAVHHQNLALPSYRYVIDDFRNKMTRGELRCRDRLCESHQRVCLCRPPPLGEQSFRRRLFHDWSARVAPSPSRRQANPQSWRKLDRKRSHAFQLRTIEADIDLAYSPDDSMLATLDALFDRQYPTCHLSDEDIEVYRTTLRLLRDAYAMPLLPHQTLGVKLSMFIWVERIPQRYLELLSDLKPQALVLLAHFCTLLKEGATRYWYMEGAAERLLSALHDVLDEEWRPWIAWPLEKVNIIDVRHNE
jgi:hypothetical protein